MIKKLEFETRTYEVPFGEKKLKLETGKMAGLASGTIVASYQDTVVLAAVVVAPEAKEGTDFFPLMVDYEERFYAAGKISGSRFIKREGRPSDAAVLASRKIDRPIRPLFPKSYRNDVQIIITVLSYDGSIDPDVIATIAASSALMQTNAPYKGPIGAVTVGMVDDKFVLNPSEEESEKSTMLLNFAATKERIMMIETEAEEVDEDKVFEGIKFGHEAMQAVIEIQHQIALDHKREVAAIDDSKIAGVHAEIYNMMIEKVKEAVKELDREAREAKLKVYEEEALSALEGTYKQVEIKGAFGKLVEKEIRHLILDEGIRPDGRAMEEIRPLNIEVGVLPRPHGSALFTRGQTQALTVLTLASPGMEQMIDTMEGESTKRYMHHYNFPPYSTGEVRPMRGTGRREIGHGYLAEKALKPMIPDQDSFPYTIRLVSEILSSNGSSSMAATCGSTLALMDAGVPIKKPVSGIAMGLVTNEDASQYKVLSDLQGLEDFAGDMDFKVAGTTDGITAIQMDTKIAGLTYDIIRDTLAQAKKGRAEILAAMLEVIPSSRKELSKYAPRIEAIKINPDKIGELIGPGGKNIKKIVEECGGKEIISIDIEDDGTVMVSSIDPEMGDKAIGIIKMSTRDIQPGEILTGPIVDIKKDRMTGKEIGAIFQITPKMDGMIHISQISNERIERVSDKLKVGQIVTVRVAEVDAAKGRIGLTMKGVDQTGGIGDKN
ncbi:MAG: polyribonucleotide nucleotidyltransferase [Candidatus Berkelbacteria bacterium]|nr:polyribonucleotide nucleotidyltransferase [Candidatus Berkelbacteria bacterium]